MNQGYPSQPFGAPPARRDNGCARIGLFGCAGLIGLFIVIFVIVAIAGSRGGHRGGGFDAKATPNERVASERAGGFSDEDKRLYHLGITHAVNAHLNLGSLTIGQVIDQERAREQQRGTARDRAVDAKETVEVRAAEEMVNQKTGQAVFRGELVQGDRLALKLDANVWDVTSDQDKKIVEQNWATVWARMYSRYHGGNAAQGHWVTLDFYDLADRRVYHENFQIVRGSGS